MRRRWGAVLTALALAVPVASATTVAGPATPAHAAGTAVLGDYAAPILNSAGRIDVAATIDRLVGAHVNTYAYLICGGPKSAGQWADLPAFTAAAQSTGISVWVYLCPPSEAKDSSGNPDMDPYNWDYVTWVTEIAKLSLTYPNLTGYAIDDFYGNLSTFTRAYVDDMVSAGRAVNPGIRFLPVLYYSNVVGYSNIVGPYRYYIDGAIFPYRDESGGKDTTNSANADPETRAYDAGLNCTHGTRCAQLYFPPNTASSAGWGTQISETVSVDPSATSYGLTLDVWDDYTGTASGYRYARVLVDGHVVWSQDVAGAESTRTVTVPSSALYSALSGRTSATLMLQMFDARPVSNFHTVVNFDNLRATGFTVPGADFEPDTSTPWVGTRSSSAYLYGYVKNIDPVVMVYASKLASEPSPPTPTYVGEVLDIGLNLTTAGVAEGTITYVLNLTGKDTSSAYAGCYDVTASRYGAY